MSIMESLNFIRQKEMQDTKMKWQNTPFEHFQKLECNFIILCFIIQFDHFKIYIVCISLNSSFYLRV